MIAHEPLASFLLIFQYMADLFAIHLLFIVRETGKMPVSGCTNALMCICCANYIITVILRMQSA